jgi:hypothetical protein
MLLGGILPELRVTLSACCGAGLTCAVGTFPQIPDLSFARPLLIVHLLRRSVVGGTAHLTLTCRQLRGNLRFVFTGQTSLSAY